jgi:hypothetical protein
MVLGGPLNLLRPLAVQRAKLVLLRDLSCPFCVKETCASGKLRHRRASSHVISLSSAVQSRAGSREQRALGRKRQTSKGHTGDRRVWCSPVTDSHLQPTMLTLARERDETAARWSTSPAKRRREVLEHHPRLHCTCVCARDEIRLANTSHPAWLLVNATTCLMSHT